MRYLILSLCLTLPFAAPAAAQSALDGIEGLYGSTVDPLQSCATNPHRIEIQTNPPHLILRWSMPRLDRDGRLGQTDVYDLRGAEGNTLKLNREGERARSESGARLIWLLRRTEAGYCLGRADWSAVRCIEPAERCDQAAPTS